MPVALVTGASRGIARGVGITLGGAGFRVYLMGRTVNEGEAAVPLPGSLTSTADAAEAAGGSVVALPCDHRDELAEGYGFTDTDGTQPRSLRNGFLGP